MIEYNGSNYELKYSIKRINLIEAALKKPVLSMLSDGFLTIADLTACVAYGLKLEGAEGHLAPKKGLEIAEEKISEDGGYLKLSDEFAEAIERDCPFFFQVG